MKYIKKEGDIMPPFYYGLAYRNWENYNTVYYIMPFNYLIRWKRFIHHWWIKNIQLRESWFDKEVKKIESNRDNTYWDMLVSSEKQVIRYHRAYYECLSAILKSNVPQETRDKLHNL